MRRTSSILRNAIKGSIIGAILGAALWFAVSQIAQPSKNPFEDISGMLSEGFLGIVLGAISSLIIDLYQVIFDISNAFQEIADDIQKSLNRLERMVQFSQVYKRQSELLMQAEKHVETVKNLLHCSLGERCHYIPNINKNYYRIFLIDAIGRSDKYEGIKRETIGSFEQDHDGRTRVEEYLNALSQKKMSMKLRIFVIDSRQQKKMEQELGDKEILEYYWLNNSDVRTYWITTDEIMREYGGRITDIPEDCAIYDNELKIEYWIDQQILRFGIITGNEVDPAVQLFRFLDEQLRSNYDSPFKKISNTLIDR